MAVAFVQKVASISGHSGTTVVLTVGTGAAGFSGTTTAGHLLSLAAGGLAGAALTGVTDSRGNTWQVDAQGASTTGPRAGLASCIVAAGKILITGDTITLTWSVTTTAGYATVSEYSGALVTSGGLPATDQVIGAYFAGAAVTAVTPSPAAVAGELAVSACMADLNTGLPSVTTSDATSGGTWTDLAWPGSPTRFDVAYQAVPGLTTVTAAWGYATAPKIAAAVACYQPASTLAIPTVFAGGQVGVPYSQLLAASGGTPPYTFTVTSGALPPGVALTGGGGGGGGPGVFGVSADMTGLTVEQATQQWAGTGAYAGQNVNRPVAAMKQFYQQSDGLGSQTFFPQVPDGHLQACIDLGMTCYVCYKPAFNPTTTADYNALHDSLAALKAAGAKVECVLFQEIEHQGLTAAQYFNVLSVYGPAVTAALGAGHLWHVSAGSYPGKWAQFFPAPPNTVSALVTGASTDYYAKSYAPPKNILLAPFISLCTAAGIPFRGVLEFGLSSTPPSNTVVFSYLAYLISVAAAYPGTTWAWFQNQATSPYDCIPGYAAGAAGGPDCIPQLQQLADTIAAGGSGTGAPWLTGGTPGASGAFGFTLKVTDSVSATASVAETITIIPAAPPPPPPPPRPVPAASMASVPVAKPWRFLIAAPQPQGGWTYEVSQAATRTLTMRAGAGLFHEATIDILGTSPAASQIFELQADLQVMLGGNLLFCGRFGATQDTLDQDTHRFAPTATDYREVLRRRSLAYTGGPSYGGGGTDVQQIAWNLIQQTQGTPGGNLGIVQGQGKGGIGGTPLVVNYDRQDYVGLMIDQLAQMTPGSFDWDITPYGSADLRLDVWSPNRGVNRGVTLEYGGSLVSSVTRNTDPSLFADSVFVVGQNKSGMELYSTPPAGSAGAVDAPDIATRPEGRWDSVIGLTAATQQGQLDAATQFYLQDGEAVLPTYTVVMRPGTWQGINHIWLGDTVTIRINSGRLAVNDQVRVQELDFVIGPDNIETVTLILGRYPFRFGQQIASIFRRLRNLETL